jgi:protein-disulfide isomerase
MGHHARVTQPVDDDPHAMAPASDPTNELPPSDGEPDAAGEWPEDADGPDVPGAVRRQNRLAAVGLVAVAIVLAFGAGIAIGRATAPTGPGAVTPVAEGSPGEGSPAPTAIAGLPSDGPRLGPSDAKVVIDYWADFQCPYCARFAETVIPALESRIANGTVALVHRDYAFIGDESVDAAIAVRCAGRQGRYWPMHDAMYAAQQGENQGAFVRTRLLQIATSVGLDAAAFEGCLDDRSSLVEVLDDTSAGVRTGVVSTPTIDVNGTRFLGVPDLGAFLAAIDAAAAGASPAPLPTPDTSPDPWSGTAISGREAGDAAAPITVELWMDYQATGSAMIVNDLEPALRTRIATGAIRVDQRDLATLGDESVLAAATARCVARQGGKAWFTHDVLAVSAQGPQAGIFTPRNILRFGSRLGLDIEALSACIDDPSVSAEVQAETADGQATGLTEAPAVIIRKGDVEVARFSGTLDVDAILAAIDGAG